LYKRSIPSAKLEELRSNVDCWFDLLSVVRRLLKEKNEIHLASKEETNNQSHKDQLNRISVEVAEVKRQLAPFDRSVVDMIRLPNDLAPNVPESGQKLTSTPFVPSAAVREEFLVGETAELKWKVDDLIFSHLQSELGENLICSPPHFMRSAVVEACQPPLVFSEEVMTNEWNVKTLRMEDISAQQSSTGVQCGQHLASDPLSPMMSVLVRRTFSPNTRYPLKLLYPSLTIYRRDSVRRGRVSQSSLTGVMIVGRKEDRVVGELTRLRDVLLSLAAQLKLTGIVVDVPVDQLLSYESAAMELIVQHDHFHAVVARVGLSGDYFPTRLMIRHSDNSKSNSEGTTKTPPKFLQMVHGWVDTSKLFQFLFTVRSQVL